MYKKRIMIDLDGVLNNYKYYDEDFIPEIKEGAKEFLQGLYDTGEYELFLFTTRNKILVTKWLIENNIDMFFKDITNIKEPAFVYLDDRAVMFNGDYIDTMKQIKNFQTYWK